jgi:NTP pyrophosphatase (non-canonical NTP hydrolase)
MRLTNEFQPIRDWAQEKGIYDKGDIKTQSIKFYEEAGELAKAVLNEDTEEILDAIGDSIVVLTSVAHFAGLTVEECINEAYNVIDKRKGTMQNGTFVKE